jgi:hypothetical protein
MQLAYLQTLVTANPICIYEISFLYFYELYIAIVRKIPFSTTSSARGNLPQETGSILPIVSDGLIVIL